MASYDTPAVVLRTIRYSEADVVLALYTRERGRAPLVGEGPGALTMGTKGEPL